MADPVKPAAPAAAPTAAPIKPPGAGASDPALKGAGPAPATPASPASEPKPRERDPQTGQFLPRDQSIDLQDKLWGDGDVEVAPEDKAISDLDGNEPREVRLRVTRPDRANKHLEAQEPAPAQEGDASASASVEAGAGAEATGVEAPAPLDPATQAPAPEASDPDPNALIDLVIDGSPVVYKNKAHLQQAVKSLRGMYNTAERERLKLVQANTGNFTAAQAWEQTARRLGYKDDVPVGSTPPGAAPQGRSPAPGQPGQDAAGRQAVEAVSDATGAPEEQIAAAVDWDVYNTIKREKGSEVAVLWANAQMIAAAMGKTSQRIEEMQRPAKEAAEVFKTGEAYGETMLEMAGWANNDGSPTYPELADDTVIEELSRVLTAFQKQGMPTDFLKSKRGMHTAILTWRDWRAAKGNPWTPATQAPAASSQPAVPPSTDGIAEAVASVAGTARTVTSRNEPARPSTPAAARQSRLVDQIVGSDRNVHGDFPWSS